MQPNEIAGAPQGAVEIARTQTVHEERSEGPAVIVVVSSEATAQLRFNTENPT
jgi:hypothetical protein